MKVGVLQFFSWPDRRIALEDVYHRAFERIAIMDQTGYDAVWLAEHHFSSFSICPSIHLMGAHIAARTRRLRIGTGVSLAPFYNPLRLAEEVALLDVLSGGRVNWGVGRGYQEGEFAAFGVVPATSYELVREHVSVVIQAWTEERLTFHGNFVHVDGVEVLPKPAQRPHPPVWLAASSPEAIQWAGDNGFSILLDPHSGHHKLGEKRRFYQQALERGGRSLAGRDLPMARLLAVAETRAQATEIARKGAEWTVRSHHQAGVKPTWVDTDTNREHRELTMDQSFDAGAVDRYLKDVIIYGTPEEVLDQLLALRTDIGLEYLLCAPLSHESFVLFTDRVLPRLP